MNAPANSVVNVKNNKNNKNRNKNMTNTPINVKVNSMNTPANTVVNVKNNKKNNKVNNPSVITENLNTDSEISEPTSLASPEATQVGGRRRKTLHPQVRGGRTRRCCLRKNRNRKNHSRTRRN